jgi:2'-5' RNA ligase
VTRLSVAVRPPRAVLDRVAALPRPPHPGLNWSAPEQWIVKLRPLGHVSDSLVGPLGDALAAALDGAPSPECVLGPATVRPGGQWLYAPVSGLDELADEVFGATEHLVPVTHPQPYVGALVLARGRVPAEVAGVPVDGTWRADAVVLVADRSAPGRPRLVDLVTLTLEGRSETREGRGRGSRGRCGRA